MKEKKSDAISKLDYVRALEKSYVPPNQEGFGGAVFLRWSNWMTISKTWRRNITSIS